MLDTDTKRRIDTARDFLVGKVPGAKTQSSGRLHTPRQSAAVGGLGRSPKKEP